VALPHAQHFDLVAGTDDPAQPRTQVTWYRLSVPAIEPTSDTLAPRYLYLPRWKADGQLAVYVNERLVHRSDANRVWNGFNQPLWIALGAADLGPSGTAQPIRVEVRVEHLRAVGSAISSAWVGTQADIGWRYRMRDTLQTQVPLMTSAAFLAVGVFALFVWARQRWQGMEGGPLNLLFFVMSAVSYLRNLHYHVGQFQLPVSDAWFGWVTVSSLFWLVATGHFFIARLHARPSPWLDKGVLGITGLVTVLTLPAAAEMVPGASELAPFAYAILLTMGVAVFTRGWMHARQARQQDALLLSVWGLFGMAAGLHDWLIQNNYFSVEDLYLGAYISCGIFAVFMHALLRQYTSALQEAQRANASLAQRLQAQEAHLTASHARLREVEQRQTLSQERQRLMQDMHDGLGSSLVSALRVVEAGQLRGADVAEVLRGCIDDLKLAIDSMEPVEADLLLLLATLRYRLGSRLKQSGIHLVWNVQEVPALTWLDPRNSLHILRILQEALANTLKHASATEITVSTHAQSGVVCLVITDNGQGFAVHDALLTGGRGLANQQRRARAIGADITLQSTAAGTTLTLELPLHRPRAAEPSSATLAF
jgi:signal transduction histidine kinase